jgi:glycosyltransferase involved in cell wall biosynthesis
LQHRIILHKPMTTDEIGELMLKSLALVLPSHSEPWGLVVNEALSYGCPVVASDHCGCVPELVKEGVTGFSFETGNVAALAKAMRAVMALSRDRERTAHHCLEAIAQYTPRKAAEQIYDGCLRTLQRPAV